MTAEPFDTPPVPMRKDNGPERRTVRDRIQSAHTSVQSTLGRGLDTAGLPFKRPAAAWKQAADARTEARSEDALDALREANRVHRDAMRALRNDRRAFEKARGEVPWWNVFNGERRAARAVIRDSREIAREANRERRAARKAYPMNLPSLAARCHVAHFVPAGLYELFSETFTAHLTFGASATAVAVNLATATLGMRHVADVATDVALESLQPSQEERDLLHRLSPKEWMRVAQPRGLEDVVASGATLTESGIQVKLTLNGQMTVERLRKMDEQLRAALRLREGTRMELRPGKTGGHARMTLRTRSTADGLDMTGWKPGDSWAVNTVTGEVVPVPLGKRILFAGTSGAGKALALDTRIPTPDGFKLMGDLVAGDTVFGLDGKPCNVTAAHDVMYGHDCFRVAFSDGTSVVADADHLWATNTANDRHARKGDTSPARRNRLLVRTTREIADTLVQGAGTTRESWNHVVPVAGGLDLPDADLMIPPYTLGAWLGDGTSREGRITNVDQEVLNGVKSDGYDVYQTAYDVAKGLPVYSVRGLHTQLEALGVRNNKHIPTEYLRASETQRRALLAGLLDTDGSATKNGSVEFYNKSERLARGVFHLAASLGYKPTIRNKVARLYGKDCGTVWTVAFTTADHVFTLPRKNDRINATQRVTNGRRYIVGCEPVESVPVRCIAVDSPDRLFLVTEACIATHNTWSARPLMAEASEHDDHRLVIFDRKYVEGRNWEHRARVATELDEMRALCEELIAEGEDRLKTIPRGEDVVTISPARPRITVFVDEGGELIADSKTKHAEDDEGRKSYGDILDSLRTVARKLRAAEIILVWCTQKPALSGDGHGLDSQVAGQLVHRLSLALATTTDTQVVFGNDAIEKGWKANELPMPGFALFRNQELGPKSVPQMLKMRAMSPADVIALPPRPIWSRRVSSTGATARDLETRKTLEAAGDQWSAPADGCTQPTLILGSDIPASDSEQTRKQRVPSADRDDQIMTELREDPCRTLSDIARAVGASKSVVKKRLEQMEVDGLVMRDDDGCWSPVD